ncbi:MAG: PHP domain-containing protein [Clostridia bacterium]
MKLYGLQFEVDPHVHTVVSGHSWSTLSDYVAQAKHIGMKGFCVTEHGPATPRPTRVHTTNTNDASSQL